MANRIPESYEVPVSSEDSDRESLRAWCISAVMAVHGPTLLSTEN